ncbi:MAG: ABC transporter ATP-binding protein [Candidatus Thermoplasmatota archaeon]|nr:ABC transporter ATP-binding protein [Candidatus Thermoplasmatota archaeon]OWP54334.1 MAG: hypothetical protein B2I18_03380 [Cuniculiplasma sp. C_DKE]
MLELDNIRFRRGELEIGPVSMTLSSGEILSICGKNGSGKTSTLTAISGYIPLMEGSITVDGENLRKLKPSLVARKVSYVQQEIPEPMGFTVRDVMEISGFTRMGGDREIRDALRLCGVEKFIDRDFATLSGGEKRMVSIAGGIYQDSDYIMMDEPTSFLDLDKISTLIRILNSLKAKGKGVLLVMHDINLANRISDSILLFREGKVVAFGEKDDVLTINNLEKAYNAKFAKYSSPEGIRFYPVEMEDFTDFPEEAREDPQHS